MIASLMVIGLSLFTRDAIANGDVLRVWYGLAGVLVGITSVAVILPILRVRRTRMPRGVETGTGSDGLSALRIYYVTYWRRALTAWLAVGAAFLVIRGLMFIFGMSSDTTSSGRSAVAGGGLLVVLIALALAVAVGLHLYSSRNRRGRVALTRDGVSIRIGGSVSSVDWDDIGDVIACIVNNAHTVRIVPAQGKKIDVTSGKSLIDRLQAGLLERRIDIPVWVLGMDPALFFHTVRFYWQHPESRDELSTDAVIERMRRGDVAVDV
ncbi:hypothetical protein GV791_04845 [Nocardia cyriacigeorgica]|uniref:PH domain-containing protein n=1 Tax=Nocardia cyriacigeorgica TaxID=135487 RepID=A0A6P1CH66_9NOCA|nr:hypothetical protein [Nocardia cyriacigeorgica]MBF6425472.1 hypothetical protein [Nocardia cyriacigeorgica]NEW31890.1 hypothetical protein [Nocardia cyriacigeorgica]